MPTTVAKGAELSLPEACRLLRRPYTYTWALLLTGQLDARKVGGRWAVTRESVEAARRREVEDKGGR